VPRLRLDRCCSEVKGRTCVQCPDLSVLGNQYHGCSKTRNYLSKANRGSTIPIVFPCASSATILLAHYMPTDIFVTYEDAPG